MENSSQEPVKAKVVMAFDPQDIADNKIVAALSYIGILVFVPLLLKRNSKFAFEHAKQGLVVLIIGMVGWLVFWIPLIGWAAAVLLFAVDVAAFIHCLNGEFWEIPVIGEFRNKFNL